jgi:hypothetical protein
VDDIQEIKNKIYAYAERLDTGDIEGFAGLFENATFRTHGVDLVAQGVHAVRELVANAVIFYEGSPATKHIITNIAVEIDGMHARARSYFTVLQARPGQFPLQPIVAGRYHDRFQRFDDEWRYVDHLIFVDLLGDPRFHLKGARAARDHMR